MSTIQPSITSSEHFPEERKLAIFGGPPAFAEPLHVGQPNLGDRDSLKSKLDQILDSRLLTNNGPFAQELERRVEQMLGVPHAVAVCNATLGLELVIKALAVEGDVVLPSFTFCATAHAVVSSGATTRFCDVDPDLHTLSVKHIEAAITKDTSCLLGVHLWGNACPVDEIEDFARHRGLRVVYDAAHAFGCSAGSKSIGNFGDAEVFSLHATKYVNSFEGGVITTRNEGLAKRLRAMRNFGFEEGSVRYLGTNAKMSEISAAMGLVSLDAIADFEQVNAQNRECYGRYLKQIPGVRLFPLRGGQRHNSQYVVIEVNPGKAGISRDQLLRVLQHENVLARAYFSPSCHRLAPFVESSRVTAVDVPNTEQVSQRAIALPTGTCVSQEAIHLVCKLIYCATAQAAKVRNLLSEHP